MENDRTTLEKKYQMIVKLACLAALVVIVLMDAVTKSFQAPKEVELALVAAVAGLEVREKGKQAIDKIRK